jgi:hypothetical protein
MIAWRTHTVLPTWMVVALDGGREYVPRSLAHRC